MSIEINKNICIGCGRCTKICPGNLIAMDKNKKPFINKVDRCWGCLGCMKECPIKAIKYYLDEEIEGTPYLTLLQENNKTIWSITSEGKEEVIETISSESNRY